MALIVFCIVALGWGLCSLVVAFALGHSLRRADVLGLARRRENARAAVAAHERLTA